MAEYEKEDGSGGKESSSAPIHRAISDRPPLIRNAALNLAAQVAPLAIAVLTIPYVLVGLGVERFGLLALGRAALGYFSVVEFGLGRTTTRFVAESLGAGKNDRIPPAVWTSFVIQLAFGVLGGLIVALAASWMVETLLRLPGAAREEGRVMFYLLGACLPVVVLGRVFRGVLEGSQRFDLVTAIQIPTSSVSFFMPAAGVFLGFGLPGIVSLLFLGWLVSACLYLLASLRVWPALRRAIVIEKALMWSMLSYGGWITVSDLLIPLGVYAERWLLGVLVSVDSVAYYSVPYEIVSRLLIIPAAVGVAVFPAFSAGWGGSRLRVTGLYARSLKYVLLGMGPLTGVGLFFGGTVLRLWLGEDLAGKTTVVFQVLAVGMLLNALAQMSANVLDAAGRPDLRAKVLLSYTAGYVAVAWVLVRWMGTVGAALAWTLRAGVEMVVFAWVSSALLGVRADVVGKSGVWRAFVTVGCFWAALGGAAKLGGERAWLAGMIGVLGLGVFVWLAWRYALDESDRSELRDALARVTRSAG